MGTQGCLQDSLYGLMMDGVLCILEGSPSVEGVYAPCGLPMTNLHPTHIHKQHVKHPRSDQRHISLIRTSKMLSYQNTILKAPGSAGASDDPCGCNAKGLSGTAVFGFAMLVMDHDQVI